MNVLCTLNLRPVSGGGRRVRYRPFYICEIANPCQHKDGPGECFTVFTADFEQAFVHCIQKCIWNLSIRSSPWQSANAEVFAEAYLCVFSICLGKKNAEAIKFLGILKKICLQE